MEIKIISDRQNPLLSRREIRFIVAFEGATPTIKDVKLKLAAMLNADKNMLIVDKIDQEFGKLEARGYAKLYFDEKIMNMVEKKSVLEKNKTEEEVAAEGE
jgi:small subunit ribosomal protein S24e